ncbi:Sm-like protein [Martiniozyma asiatica (nom. inval.)]|nr:Sm-like protein [Martiniozyma asiatica]
MLFFSFFKTLVDQEVKVELKNDIQITGTLKSVDQFLNMKLDNVSVDTDRYPHFLAMRNLFLRGSAVRYIHLKPQSVDTQLLQDASRREAIATSGEKIEGR